MTYRRFGIPIVALAGAIVASAIAIAPAAGASSTRSGVTRQVAAAGTTSYSPSPSGSAIGVQNPELGPGLGDSAAPPTSPNTPDVNRSKSNKNDSLPRTQGSPVSTGVDVHGDQNVNVLSSFDGLNHFQQRHANNNNQFSLEPPDQGLCAGNGVVMEIINDVMRVYAPDGAPLKGVEDLNTFFGYPPAFVRPAGPLGQFVTDPSCLYDKNTNRWFADVLTIETFPDTGEFTGANHLDLAVSNTADPTGKWTIYRVQVQDDGKNGTPNHGCTGLNPPLYGNPATPPTYPNACLGDYPHLGADANGIYLTTNEYSFFGNDFHGAQIYAFSKAALAALSSNVNVTQIDTNGMDNGNSGFTVWPAVAPAGLNSSANGGTEFFMSSNAADEAHGNGASPGPRRSNQLLVWTLSHTASLKSDPDLELSHATLRVGLYVVPDRSVQKVGSTPLIDCLNNPTCSTNFLLGVPDPFAESEYALDSNDTRMQQVVFANGKLWAALDTKLRTGSTTQSGVEWFVVNVAGGGEDRANVRSGYLAVKNNNLIYPAIAVNPSGNGVMAFTLVGRDYYPSAAFASMDQNGARDVQIVAAGAGPADGFSGTAAYNAPNPARPRWGDYGAAVVDGSNIWIASEYIGQTCTLAQYLATGASCGGTRTALANWDTRITEIGLGDQGGSNN